MAGQGSGGNMFAALASLFFPGFGQLLQGRVLAAFVHFVLTVVLWFFLLGWLMHIISAISAARFNPAQPGQVITQTVNVAAVAQPERPIPQASMSEQLRTLAELRDQGAITDDEYQMQKQRLLA